MKILTSKIVNGKKMFLIEDNDSQGRVFAQGGKPIKKENISYYNPYYVDIKGINSSDNVSTKSTPSKKITPQELKQIKESPTNVGNIVLKEKQEKAQRLKEAEEAYKKRKAGASITPELLVQETQAIGDKISLQNIPGVGQYIPDMLDVTGMIGNMASGLGRVPLNLEQRNYGQAALSVATPLTVGALAGIGTQNTSQFVNNLVNPLAGTGQIINNLGNKYLPNAHKLNPFAFKPNKDMLYRGLGKEGVEDALKSKVLRPKQYELPEKETFRDILNRPKDFKTTFYSPNFKTADTYGNGFIAEVSKDAADFVKRYGKKDWSVHTSKQIPINEVNLLEKDWLKGYKPIEIPKKGFSSEIDWGKWNKEIPENKALMQEYNAIEQQAKANGTWMKNPDGSAFQGTPEQFVQQNSQNFKRAFGNSKLINPEGSPTIQYHGSAKKFDAFDESKFQLGDSGYSGVGIYTTPSKSTAQSYAMSSSSFHSGKIEPTVYELYGQANNPISSSQLIKENKGRDLFNFHRKNNWKGELTPEESLMEFDAAIADQLPNVERIRPWNDAREIVFPSNKQLKSAIGNNGMFDMTNPNIYKTVVGALATGTLGKQAMEKKEFGGKIKVLDTKIENGKKYFLINN